MNRFETVKLAGIAAAALAVFVAAPLAKPAVAQMSHEASTLIPSVKSVDAVRHQAVFPLHRGLANGRTVWYILTDVSDVTEASAKGLVFAPALAAAGVTQAVTANGSTWQFSAAPDFSPARVFQAGAMGFPPASAAPGATASAAYSPFVHVGSSSTVYNAPIVAVGDGPFDVVTHTNTADRVLAIDSSAGTVTLLLADGFADGKRVLYISTEASDAGAATIERATYVPSLANTAASARLPIYVVANGPTGRENPAAQGLAFAALDGGLSADATNANSASLQSSRNVLSSAPAMTASGNTTYSPLWNVYLGVWSAAAKTSGRVAQLTSAQMVAHAASSGDLTGPDGKAFGPVGFAVNCPVVAIVP